MTTAPTGASEGMTVLHMKRLQHALLAATLAAAAALAVTPAAAARWDGAFVQVQGHKGRGGGDRGDRGDRERDRGREAHSDRHDERRERMSEDDRRSLHRDLDKANRELYGRRFGR
jgi:hypothetical protein